MEYIQLVLSTLGEYHVYLVLGLVIWCLIITIYAAKISGRLRTVIRRRNARIEDGSIGEIADSLGEISSDIFRIESGITQLIDRQNSMDRRITGCVQRFGVVRFDAFSDVGGEQSFAVAIVDENCNGLIISNLYGRQDSRLYIKRIQNGRCDRPLSEEEQTALDRAMQNEESKVEVRAR